VRSIIKVHKPIIAARLLIGIMRSTHFTWAAARLLHEMLWPFVRIIPTVCSSSKDLLASLADFSAAGSIPSSAGIASMDVTALYPSIKLHDGMAAFALFLHLHCPWTLEVQSFCFHLMLLTLTHNTCTFRGIVYLQAQGTAMGVPNAVVYAIIFMWWVERHLTLLPPSPESPPPPLFYTRFIDDIFAILQSSEVADSFWCAFSSQVVVARVAFAELYRQVDSRAAPSFPLRHPLLESLLSLAHSSIVVSGVSFSSRANFLDLTITISPSPAPSAAASFSTALYQKPTTRHLHLPFSSNQPPSVKVAFLRHELARARLNFSSTPAFLAYRQQFYSTLLPRGFPKRFILDAWQSVSLTRSLARPGAAPPPRPPAPAILPLALPYTYRISKLKIEQLVASLRRVPVLSDSRPLVAFKRTQSLRGLFIAANAQRFCPQLL
jgi:hypothetical protein